MDARTFLEDFSSGVLTEIHDPIGGKLRLEDVGRAVVVLKELVLLQEGEGGTVLGDGLAAQEAAARLHDEVRGLRCVELHYVGLQLNVRVLGDVVQTS